MPKVLERIGYWSRKMSAARIGRDRWIREAVARGFPLREVGRAAGVDASTVKRIAERQK